MYSDEGVYSFLESTSKYANKSDPVFCFLIGMYGRSNITIFEWGFGSHVMINND